MAQDEKKSETKELKDFAVGAKMIELNKTCADCDAPNPTWAVLNHGILICISCAGVHRALGAHISKVRSINGDKWTESMIDEMCKKNRNVVPTNEEFDKIYEYCVDSKKSDYYKPVKNSGRELREKYIRAKYEKRLFCKDNEINANIKQASVPLFDPNPQDDDKNNNGVNGKGGGCGNNKVGSVETTGIIDLLFMNASNLPIADVALVGGKSDPYVCCYQTKKLKDDKERKKFGTQIIESNLNPVWTTEEDKKLLDQGKATKKKDIKRINLTVNENTPIIIEVWDHDSMSNDDLMCFTQLDILKECPKSEQEYKIVKELTIVPEFQNQKKYKKYKKKASIVFYAKYNKLF